jgi:MFS transporter, OFA family, oxalate/formate antiporter
MTVSNARSHWLAKRLPFFYGWMIIPVGILSLLATSPGQTMMISVFNPSLRAALGLSLSQVTAAYMAGTLAAALPQPYLGYWMDRLGIRTTTLIIVGILGLACIFMARVQNLLMLLVAFFLLRLFGQGALALTATNMLPMWFNKRLGITAGIMGVVQSLILGTIPVGVLALINLAGWRNTYLISGGIVWLVMIPILLFIYVSRPEEIGQHVDNESLSTLETPETGALDVSPSLTLNEAMRTSSYWIMVVVMTAWGMIMTALFFNALPIFTGRGLSEAQAATTYAWLFAVIAVTQILGGYLADRIKLNLLAAGSLLCFTFGIITILYSPVNYLIAGYALVLGLAQGLLSAVGNTVWARYFGTQHLGKIRGVAGAATVVGTSAGPFLMGLAYDHFGDYRLSLMVCAVLFLGLSLISLKATPPEKMNAAV